MLVLKRKPKQEIILADGLIKIVVIHTSAGVATIGIDAPKDISVVRGEMPVRGGT